MRHPVVEFATGSGALAFVAAAALCCGGRTPMYAQAGGDVAARPSVASPAASAAKGDAKTGKKPKKARELVEPAATPHATKPKELQFPLGIGDDAKTLRIPETSQTGQLLSQLMAAKATRIDNEHVQMNEMNIDLYHPDGKEDFHVVMPTSVFDLNTRIITSQDPVTVRTQDFELTGEKMEFNTVERTGKLIGKVRMLIHNLKQVTGPQNTAAKTE